MSNGVKIGLLVVIAGILGLVAFKMTSANDELGARPANDAAAINTSAEATAALPTKAGANPNQASAGQASQARAKTSIQFEKTEHDFGKLKQGDEAEYKFKFTNTGKEPLIIENATGSCGCTVPSYPKEPVAPGASGEIMVKFNSAGKSNAQQKTVTLTANTEPIQTILTIKAFVEVVEKK
jgi:uncharacterized cupredoxin-like copper-binding protein